MRTRHGSAILMMFLATFVFAQETYESGPKGGTILPAPFDAYNVSGENKGRQHCLVCSFGLDPVVAVFAREPGEGKDEPLTALLTRIDETVQKHKKIDLRSYAVFLSPDARSSANSTETDSKKLVEEAIAREALYKRLGVFADKAKDVVIAAFLPEGPKEWKIHPKAEVTVVFYQKHKVIANWAFGPGKLTAEDADKIAKTVDERFASKK